MPNGLNLMEICEGVTQTSDLRISPVPPLRWSLPGLYRRLIPPFKPLGSHVCIPWVKPCWYPHIRLLAEYVKRFVCLSGIYLVLAGYPALYLI